MTAYSTTNPKFDKMLQRMGALHDAKNKGYAVAEDPLQNFRLCERFGIPMYLGIAVRLSDKMNRWMNIVGDAANDAVDEPVEETAEDIAVYTLLFLMALEEWKATHAVGDVPIMETVMQGLQGQPDIIIKDALDRLYPGRERSGATIDEPPVHGPLSGDTHYSGGTRRTIKPITEDCRHDGVEDASDCENQDRDCE